MRGEVLMFAPGKAPTCAAEGGAKTLISLELPGSGSRVAASVLRRLVGGQYRRIHELGGHTLHLKRFRIACASCGEAEGHRQPHAEVGGVHSLVGRQPFAAFASAASDLGVCPWWIVAFVLGAVDGEQRFQVMRDGWKK